MKGGIVAFFFFSSRRRHTRWNCDWSSDVCSSDLCTELSFFPDSFPRESGPLARRSIRDFTENCWATGARCGSKVRRALMKCFVGQQRKGEGFLGVFRNTQPRRGQDFDAGQGGRELSEDQRVARAAAGNNELLDFRLRQNETV